MNNITIPKRSKNGPVKTVTVNYSVWQTALKYANNHTERIRIISPTKVEVRIIP